MGDGPEMESVTHVRVDIAGIGCPQIRTFCCAWCHSSSLTVAHFLSASDSPQGRWAPWLSDLASEIRAWSSFSLTCSSPSPLHTCKYGYTPFVICGNSAKLCCGKARPGVRNWVYASCARRTNPPGVQPRMSLTTQHCNPNASNHDDRDEMATTTRQQGVTMKMM